MTAETLLRFQLVFLLMEKAPDRISGTAQWTRVQFNNEASPRTISTGQLHALLHFHFRPINPVIYWGPYQVNPVGVLILERASRLDAFSGYPYRT
jgi:hypothetical protein